MLFFLIEGLSIYLSENDEGDRLLVKLAVGSWGLGLLMRDPSL